MTRHDGLPPVFPVVIHSGSEKWDTPLSVHELLAPVAKTLLKYQPDNLALLVDEKTITDELLNKNSDFYALFLELKRAKTPMAMHEVINRFKDVLALPEHQELCKAIIAIVETLYKRFNQDAGASDIRFASLEEAVKMIDSTVIDWKKNMREELRNDLHEEFYIEWTQEGERKGKLEGIREGKLKAKREDALAMLQEGFSLEVIGEITKLPLTELEKLQAQRV